MQLTQTEKELIYGLTLFPITEENQEAIFLFLREEQDQEEMIHYLKTHRNATEQEILNESGRILKRRVDSEKK